MEFKRNGCLALGALLLMAGPGEVVVAGPAPALTQVRIESVESPSCGVESIRSISRSTACNHGGGYLKVTVVEVGLGQNATATLDGTAGVGTRTALCLHGQSLVECGGRGTTAGYRYIYTFGAKEQGSFSVRSTSINAPRNTLSAQMYIR